MSHARYALEHMFLYNTYVKSGSAGKIKRIFQCKFQYVTSSHREIIHGIINMLRQGCCRTKKVN
jgi:hypothetical protein